MANATETPPAALDLFPAIALLEWDRIGISFWATADQILLVSQSLARML